VRPPILPIRQTSSSEYSRLAIFRCLSCQPSELVCNPLRWCPTQLPASEHRRDPESLSLRFPDGEADSRDTASRIEVLPTPFAPIITIIGRISRSTSLRRRNPRMCSRLSLFIQHRFPIWASRASHCYWRAAKFLGSAVTSSAEGDFDLIVDVADIATPGFTATNLRLEVLEPY
jgi:hypothetical protein